MTVSRHFMHRCWWLRYGSNFTQEKIHRWCPEITGGSLGAISKPLERVIMSFFYQSPPNNQHSGDGEGVNITLKVTVS